MVKSTEEMVPEAWLVEWVRDGETWAQAHASEPNAVDQARQTGGACIPMVRADLIEAQANDIEWLREALAGDREVRPMSEARLDRILEFQERVKMLAGPNDTATLSWADQCALIDEAVIAFRARALLSPSDSGRAGT